MNIKYIENRKRITKIEEAANGVSYLSFEPLNKFGFITNGFSSRIGGVSSGIYTSMNLSFTCGDEEENVRENFTRMGKALGIDAANMVLAHQTHTANVMKVDRTHAGMGIIKDRNFHDIDGIVTNVEGLCLVTSHADCIPLYFVDPEKKAIGLAHSGWKGTAGNIAKNVVEMMSQEYGTDPGDVVGVIGPGICGKCYEISEDVAEIFKDNYDSEKCPGVVVPRADIEGKYLLDLHKANYYNMLSAGLREENIFISDVCTMENADNLFSHRATQGKRGGMSAFLCINNRILI